MINIKKIYLKPFNCVQTNEMFARLKVILSTNSLLANHGYIIYTYK